MQRRLLEKTSENENFMLDIHKCRWQEKNKTTKEIDGVCFADPVSDLFCQQDQTAVDTANVTGVHCGKLYPSPQIHFLMLIQKHMTFSFLGVSG